MNNIIPSILSVFVVTGFGYLMSAPKNDNVNKYRIGIPGVCEKKKNNK